MPLYKNITPRWRTDISYSIKRHRKAYISYPDEWIKQQAGNPTRVYIGRPFREIIRNDILTDSNIFWMWMWV